MEENRNKPKVDKLNRVVSGGSGTASGDNIPSNFNQELANALLHECDLVRNSIFYYLFMIICMAITVIDGLIGVPEKLQRPTTISEAHYF